MSICIGIDLGTSGCRAIAIDDGAEPVARAAAEIPPPTRQGPFVEQAPAIWWAAVQAVLEQLLNETGAAPVDAIAVDGTSGTVLLADDRGSPAGPALMYNDNRAAAEAERIAAVAPLASAAHGTGSGLAKLLWLLPRFGDLAARVHTQADWIAGRLTGTFGICDGNNALKLGWDPEMNCWPAWLQRLDVPAHLLPRIVRPGTPVAPLSPALRQRWGIRGAAMVVAGTTDSTAAIVAAGAHDTGDGVTSLGSTLVTKVVADRPVSAREYGVYSQPLGSRWLVGGGSNSGGAVLGRFFSADRIAALSATIDPEHPTGLDYYPLLAPGERFPVNDPDFPPRLTPRPDDDALFLQGMLEGMAAIERAAYARLADLGAPYPRRVLSTGGGARNTAWRRIRENALGVPVETPVRTEACYGSALIALGTAPNAGAGDTR